MKIEVEYRGFKAALHVAYLGPNETPGEVDPATPIEFMSFYVNNQWRKLNLNLVRAVREGHLHEELKKEIDKEIDALNRLRMRRMQRWMEPTTG